MVRLLNHDKGSSPGFADFILDRLPKDPIESGFRREGGSPVSLDFRKEIGAYFLRVGCEVVTSEGNQWLRLRIEKSLGTVGFNDISFVRKAFLGSALPALICFGPDEPQQPLGDPAIFLWAPLDKALLPSGAFDRSSL